MSSLLDLDRTMSLSYHPFKSYRGKTQLNCGWVWVVFRSQVITDEIRILEGEPPLTTSLKGNYPFSTHALARIFFCYTSVFYFSPKFLVAIFSISIGDPVDSSELRQTHQLRLFCISHYLQGFIHPTGGWDFGISGFLNHLNHQLVPPMVSNEVGSPG